MAGGREERKRVRNRCFRAESRGSFSLAERQRATYLGPIARPRDVTSPPIEAPCRIIRAKASDFAVKVYYSRCQAERVVVNNRAEP